jgi:uncharacterized phage-associated protein
MKPPIRFKFDENKFIACVSMFAQEDLKALDKLKVCKLLFYADKYHLTKFGLPIIRDTYYHLDNGPIPSRALDIMNEVICKDDIYLRAKESSKARFLKYLKPKKETGHKYPTFQSVEAPDVDSLSASEQEAVRETVKRYGHYSPSQLVKLTHKEAAWKDTEKSSEIDYALFFKGDPEALEAAKEYLESMREDFVLT